MDSTIYRTIRDVHPRSSPARGCQMWLSNPPIGSVRSGSRQKTLYFQCRGRDSNPHGTFVPEDFKSFEYNEKAFVLLAFFASNVKVCKFLCKCSRKPDNIGRLQLCRSEGFPRIRISIA